MATPEAKVKAKAVAQLKALGAYYFYPVTGGYGSSGVPDIVVATTVRSLVLSARRVRTNRLRYNKRT
jgi:hypothetical protein